MQEPEQGTYLVEDDLTLRRSKVIKPKTQSSRDPFFCFLWEPSHRNGAA